MARRTARAVEAQFQTLFSVGAHAGMTDGQLLERFTTGRGEGAELAFAALFERHGPLVLGACRRILRDRHEAEDAVQATFLVLAIKSRSLWVEDSLGPWLHRVACRIAVRARRAGARREEAGRRAAEEALRRSNADEVDTLVRLLDEEIDRLPDPYREPIILCDIESHTYEEAARHLRCPVGTVKSRLARGRQRLRDQLTRRGLAPSDGAVVASFSPSLIRATVPGALADSIAQSAIRAASNPTAIGASVAELVGGALTMTGFRWIRVAAGLVIAGALLAAGITWAVQPSERAQRRDKAQGPAAAPNSAVDHNREERPPEIIARVADIDRRTEPSPTKTVAIDPKTGGWRTIATGLWPGRVSPDGRFVVFRNLGQDLIPADVGVWVYDTTGVLPLQRIFDRNGEPHWSNEGRQVVIAVTTDGTAFETWRVNADGSGRTRMPIPATDLVLDCSRDGEWLGTRTMAGDPKHRGRFTLIHPDGTGARVLTEGSAGNDRFTIFQIAPDSRSVAYVEVTTVDKMRSCRLFVVDIDGTHRRALPVTFAPGTTVGPSWSPDGKQLALNLLNSRTKEGALALVNRDGTNYRALPLPAGKWNLMVCDWKALDRGLRVGDLDQLTRPAPATARGRYQALKEEAGKATPFEPRRYIGRFLALAESAADDPVAIDAWTWVVRFGFDGPEYDRAIDGLMARAGTVKVWQTGLSLESAVSPSAVRLLRAVVEKTPARPIKGRASLALGRYLKLQAERVREIADDPDAARRWEAMFIEEGSTKARFARFAGQDPAVLIREAEEVFETTARDFDIPPADREHSLGDEARAELDGIRNLQPGKPAPAIEGEDVDGARFALGDYRGKVVVLAFWADWCRGCKVLYDEENALVARMKGRPFALLGVNGDRDRARLKALCQNEGITWRSWWDGKDGDAFAARGPITFRYNVHVWPTFYVLDHHGVIRLKVKGTPHKKRLNALIDDLVEAAEAETKWAETPASR